MRNSTLASALVAGLALSATRHDDEAYRYPTSGEGKAKRPERSPRANVGRNHPDYGLSVEQHSANKLARSGKAY